MPKLLAKITDKKLQSIKNPVLPCGEILEVFQNGKVFFVIQIKTDAGDAFEVSERFVNVIPERRQEAICRLNPEQFKRWLEGCYWRYFNRPE